MESVRAADQAAFSSEASAPARVEHAPCVRLSALHTGCHGTVTALGSQQASLSVLERRLLELGFVCGEHVEVLAAAPGGDPFVVRVGSTTLALRRREVDTVWVEPQARSSGDER